MKFRFASKPTSEFPFVSVSLMTIAIAAALIWKVAPQFRESPEWYSAIAALVSALASAFSVFVVLLIRTQIKQADVLAQLQFEDGLAKEYRELASRIPTKALIGAGLSPAAYERTFDELFRYIDLSNEQIALRARERIGDQTWTQWSEGIEFNMRLPAFRKAWSQVQREAPSQFSELAKFLSEKFAPDPKKWGEADRK